MSLYFGILAALLCIWESHGQLPWPEEVTCSARFMTQSSCVRLDECPSFSKLLMNHSGRLSPKTFRILITSKCGFDGLVMKVCCPSTSTEVTTQAAPDLNNHSKLGLINDPKCGMATTSKIFRGNKTTVGEFPWMVLLAYKDSTQTLKFNCGGSLISKRYVLTAAHCVTGLDSGTELFGVRLGEHDLSTERDCDREGQVETVCAEAYQDILIEEVHSHRGFRFNKRHNDIALIRMKQDADFRPINIRPICLPVGTAATLTHSKAIVTGWGTTETGATSQDLLQATVQIVATPKCTRLYKPLKVDIWYKQLCAGHRNGIDGCEGDSGGPLQSPAKIDEQTKYVQYGVVSFGPATCGRGALPGVYTQVVHYMDWILDTMTQ